MDDRRPDDHAQDPHDGTPADAGHEPSAASPEPPVQPVHLGKTTPEQGAAPERGGASDHGAEQGAAPEQDLPPADQAHAMAAEGVGGEQSSAATPEPAGKGKGAKGKPARGRHRFGRSTRKAPWWELPALILVAIAVAIGVKSFVIQPFYIPSESMEHTLYGCTGCDGDRILVNKTIYYVRDPEPGDIVVFDAPRGWDDEPATKPPGNPILRVVRGFGQLIGFVPPDGEILVKRVIATGGQTVKGDAEGHVMVSNNGPNGTFRTLVEPYVFNDPQPANSTVPFGPVTIPKGRLWVMGDHRTNSADSRYHCSPDYITGTQDDSDCDPKASTVPDSNVIGKAIVIAWPPSRWRTLGTPSTFESAAAITISPNGLPLLAVVPVYLVRRRSRRRR